MNKFFKDLKEGLEDVTAYKKGKVKLRFEIIKIPKAPTKYKTKDIKKSLPQKHLLNL